MKIRLATLADIPAAVQLGHTVHALTRFRAYGYDSLRVAERLRHLVAERQDRYGTHACLLAEDAQGQLAGALLACIEEPVFSSHRLASVMYYGVLPHRRHSGAAVRLLTAFRQWAQARSAAELQVGVNSGIDTDRTDRFLRKLGLRFNGGNYSMRLPAGPAPGGPT